MLEMKKGDDILRVVGGVNTIKEAQTIFSLQLDPDNRKKLAFIENEEALLKVANAIAMCQPDSVFINTGSTADLAWIRTYSLSQNEERKLAKEGHTIHFDLPQDQARLVKQTFYIINEGEQMSSLAKSLLRPDATDYIKQYMPGIMNGEVMEHQHLRHSAGYER